MYSSAPDSRRPDLSDAEQFAQLCAGPARAQGIQGPELLAQLEAVWVHAQATWPDVEVTPEAVGREVRARAAFSSGDPAGLHLADLYLVAACKTGEPAAHRHVQALVRELADAMMAREAAHLREEAAQVAVVKVLGDPTKLDSYSARGPLGAWLRAVLARSLLDLRRAAGGGHPTLLPEEAKMVASAPVDLEAELIRSRYRQELNAALAEALLELDVRTRNVLRLHLVDGLEQSDIGRIYGVDRSSVSRWLSGGRERLIQATRRALADRVGATGSTLQSLLGAFASDAQLGLTSLLRRGDR